MNNTINIHSKNQEQYLSVGIYSVKVLGGWGVTVNDFSVSLKKVDSDLIINAENTFWRYQSYAFKRRARRILVLDVYESGNYIIEFKNVKNLKVKPSSLIIPRIFEREIPNDKLEICINC